MSKDKKPNLTPASAETTPQALIIPTEREGVVLRQIATEADELALFEAVQENPEHLDQLGNVVAKRYDTLQKVHKARISTPDTEPWMGIWDNDEFKGTVDMRPGKNSSEAEIGYWLRKSAEGNGYATLAVKALVGRISPRFSRIFAEVQVENLASFRVLERSGFRPVGEVTRKWGKATVFDLKDED